MTRYQNLRTRTKVGLGVALPLLLTVVIGVVALVSISGLQHTSSWVDHTRKVLARSAEIVSAAVDMETGMRGFLLAGQEAFLEPYAQGEARVYTMLEDLMVTVSDNPGQVARLRDVEAVLRAWQADVTEMQIALRREIGDAKTMNDMARLVGEARGKVFFDRFRGQIAMFIAREEDLLDERKQTFAAKLESNTVSSTETRDAMQWVTHTYAVISETNSLLAAAVDMETGMRGFLLAGRDEFLEPLNAGRGRFFSIAAQLKRTVSDNPAQVALLTEIEATIQEWLDTIVTPMIAL
ncbi:MAG: CHASE3 domain-containing protein [Pseudomonadota bacterium]